MASSTGRTEKSQVRSSELHFMLEEDGSFLMRVNKKRLISISDAYQYVRKHLVKHRGIVLLVALTNRILSNQNQFTHSHPLQMLF